MQVKYKRLIILSAVFFLVVQTSYFWEPWLEFLGLLLVFLLVIVMMTLVGLFISHLVMLIKERFRNRQRVIVAAVLFVVVCTTFLKPTGLIDFDRLADKDLFIAMREGAANCQSVLKLKDNNTFVARELCWGISEIKGAYAIKGDTIFFTNVKPGRGDNHYYMYSVIKKKNKIEHGYYKSVGDLVLYKDKKDTTGHILWITKNDFPL
jgi:hypothetical protein